MQSKKYKVIVKDLIKKGTFKRLSFPTSKSTIRQEYLRLCSDGRGAGESACMAVARYDDDIIASNNLRDIRQYCSVHEILYLTTLDILYIAYKKGVMTEAEVDHFLYLNIYDANPSRLPFITLKSYLDSNPRIASIFKDTA
jgi:hypothetical protein